MYRCLMNSAVNMGPFWGSRICGVTIQGVIRWDPTQRNFQDKAINATTMLPPTSQLRWYT